MNWRHVRILVRKELIELIRDRRTLMSMIIAPALIGPVLMLAVDYFTQRSREQAQVEQLRVALSGQPLPGLDEALRQAGLTVAHASDPRRAVVAGESDFGLTVRQGNPTPLVEIYSDQSDLRLQMASRRVTAALESLRQQMVEQTLAARGLQPEVLTPFTRRMVNTAQPRQMSGNLLGSLIAWMVLIFLFNGAMYAAVDTTAGEKERHTMEMLLVSAAGRSEIVTAKVLLALVSSAVTATVSLVSYGVAFSSVGEGGNALQFATDPVTLGLVALLVPTLALLAAAAAVAGATPAKSSREAMSYLTPGFFLVMMLGGLTMLPGMRDQVWLAAVPFANFSYILPKVLSGTWTPAEYVGTVFLNLLYSAAAIYAAASRFKNESILFRS